MQYINKYAARCKAIRLVGLTGKIGALVMALILSGCYASTGSVEVQGAGQNTGPNVGQNVGESTAHSQNQSSTRAGQSPYLASSATEAPPLMLVTKQQHDIENFTTFNGQTIKDVKVGWESYGTLNENKDNVILITHFFTGTSHAAGKYSQDDAQSGYWDSIIGPGKAIDTNRFFVISVDSLVNINAYDPRVITTGPASIDPDTGKPYGLTFPVVTMRDFVNVQKSVLTSLGIEKLYAVAGPSMGSMQAIEWASAYPHMVPRLISVIGAAHADGWTTALLEQWTLPIKLDANWRGGNYYGQARADFPNQGLSAALALITQSALAPEFFNTVNQQLMLDADKDAANAMYNIEKSPPIVDWLMQRAAQRSSKMDANHLLYLVRANQLFMTGMGDDLASGLAQIQAKTLFITATQDLLLMPYHAQQAASIMLEQSKDVALEYLDGPLGHLEGVNNIAQHSDTIRAFLAQ